MSYSSKDGSKTLEMMLVTNGVQLGSQKRNLAGNTIVS